MNVRLLVLYLSLTFYACGYSSKIEYAESTDHDHSRSMNMFKYMTRPLPSSALLMKKVMPEQYVTRHVLTKDDLYRDYDGGNDLESFFYIELIDKATYLSMRSEGANYLSYDSLSYPKIDGILELPLNSGNLQLKDNITEDDTYKEYRYIGQFDKLNMYLLQGNFWEDWSFMLYDKKRGRFVQSFIGTPYLSYDLKHIICLEIDSFEGVGYISLYATSKDENTESIYIDPLVEMYIKSWVPYTEKNSIFWASDGYLYAPVLYSSNYWDAQGNYFGLDQYIRLRPLTSPN